MIDPRAVQLIEVVRAAGSNPRDLRDAVHEAHHALRWRVPRGRWKRDVIHAALMKSCQVRGSVARQLAQLSVIDDEALARAVEQIVCKDLGVTIEPISMWVNTSQLEAAVNVGIAVPDGVLLSRAQQHLVSRRGREAAEAVLRLIAGAT